MASVRVVVADVVNRGTGYVQPASLKIAQVWMGDGSMQGFGVRQVVAALVTLTGKLAGVF